MIDSECRITPNECRELDGHEVAVATTNFYTGGNFYYYGHLQEITEQHIKIKMKIGVKIIPISEIIEIKIARR